MKIIKNHRDASQNTEIQEQQIEIHMRISAIMKIQKKKIFSRLKLNNKLWGKKKT